METTILAEVIEEADPGLVVLGPDGRVLIWNAWMARATGIGAGTAVGRRLEDLFPSLGETRLVAAIGNALEKGLASILTPALNPRLFPLKLRRRGQPLEQMVTVKALSVAGAGRCCLIQVADTSEAGAREKLLRQQARRMEALAENHRQSEERTRAIIDNALDAILVFDEGGRVVTCNPAAERVFGSTAPTILGSPVENLVQWQEMTASHGRVPPLDIWRRLVANQGIHECTGQRADGSAISLELSLGEMVSSGRTVFVMTARDVTLRKQVEARIHYLAHYDNLTDLPNRVLYKERLTQAFAQAKRTRNPFALMMLDLDRFKQINDTLGHHLGDMLLKAAGRRALGTVRESDTVARLGGDEFAIVLTNLGSVDGAGTVAESLVAKLADPFELEGHTVRTSTSIGIAMHPTDGDTPELLMKHADLALYRAKAKGRNTYQFYVPQMDAEVQAHKGLEKDLRRALGDRGVELHYQAVFDVRGGKVAALEALARWDHRNRGALEAKDFIPVVRDTDLIVPVGHWALQRACEQTRAWLDAGVGVSRVSVNLSPAELCHRLLLPTLHKLLTDNRLDPWMLQLEFTAEALLMAAERAQGVLEELRGLGVRLAVDDFGAGVSPLDCLRRHSVDQVKIAPAFLPKEGGEALFAALVDLGHSLGATVAAKGVETETQAEIARRAGADEVQGYHLALPLPPAEVVRLLKP